MNLADVLAAKVYTQGYQQVYAYNAAGFVEYSGIAQRGHTTAQAVWIIVKYVYDGSNNVTSITMAPKGSVWDDRASLTYA